MSKLELKNILIEQIKKTTSTSLLEEACRLFKIEEEASIQPYILNQKQNEEIAEARQQFNVGDTITHEQANKEIGEWLGK